MEKAIGKVKLSTKIKEKNFYKMVILCIFTARIEILLKFLVFFRDGSTKFQGKDGDDLMFL